MKKVQLKAADEHLIRVKSDKDLFGILTIVAKAREVNIREVLSYELSQVPCFLGHNDGSLRKATKSDLAPALEDRRNSPVRLPVLASSVVYIVDGMALIQMHKSSGARTFGELASRYLAIVIAYFSSDTCISLHLVFDQYWPTSIKSIERTRRDSSDAIEVRIKIHKIRSTCLTFCLHHFARLDKKS